MMTRLHDSQVADFVRAMPAAKRQEPMAKHTSFRLGGPARLFLSATTKEELLRAVMLAKRLSIPSYLFGGGTNLLVSDDGYEGVMIEIALRDCSMNGQEVTAESGAFSALVARQSVAAGLTGFAWAVGLPGTIGGAAFGNAGCFGGEMRDVIASVDAFRLRDDRRVSLANADCQFDYRDSLFKREPHIILGCTLALSPTLDPTANQKQMQDILAARKEEQPLGQASAGCIFKNATFQIDEDIAILQRSVDRIPDKMLAMKRLSAGWLIDQAGLLGKRLGNVQVSDKHGNFFVTQGQARAQDVVALSSLVKMKVRDDFGIELHEEVQFVGFD